MVLRRSVSAICRISAFGVGLIALLAIFDSQLAAEGGEITIVDHAAQIYVAAGATEESIREGPQSPGAGGGYHWCGYFTGGPGQWHTLVSRWSEFVEDEWYYMHCVPRGGAVGVIARWITWDSGDPSDGEGVTNIEIRDWIARNLLPVEAVAPALSPEVDQITGVETWLWPGGSTATQSRQASAGGLSVVVEARFRNMEFESGEPGVDRLVCDTFVEWAPGLGESPCAHTYLHESPEGGFILESQTNWEFWWQDVGVPGFEFYAVSSPTTVQAVQVFDLEAVIRSGR